MPNATIEDYNDVHNQEEDLFYISLNKFREKMGNKKYTAKEIEDALGFLATDYLRCKGDLSAHAELFKATCKEWEMRKRYYPIEQQNECD